MNLTIKNIYVEGVWEDGTPYLHKKQLTQAILQPGDTLNIDYNITCKVPIELLDTFIKQGIKTLQEFMCKQNSNYRIQQKIDDVWLTLVKVSKQDIESSLESLRKMHPDKTYRVVRECKSRFDHDR